MSDHQNECDAIIEGIKASQEEKQTYFKEVLEGKHPGKKLYQQRIVIEFAEVIDYDKSKLVYEETAADEKANSTYLRSCSTKVDKAALQFANELQKHEKFSITSFDMFSREYPSEPDCTEVKISGVDLRTGKCHDINKIPPEVIKALKTICDKAVIAGGEGEQEKAAEATAAV